MRGIGSEVALNPKAFLEPIQRLVNSGHQRANLAWDLVGWQTHAGAGGSDICGDL